ncbi:hypothetical protein SAMN02745166_02470 [Prosthecobacter debontii]|uniref:Uncharacterized protein n=1 Tax=Prosthecobacter debontii TaxID=48467 RepID=A0A1T4Y4Z5_9BACT|nr:hypothetical protein [Prosthecobacter debontii]SKA96806.1 hypothetical protein SAMN02745166_02470 [Prosthecobacter debontii]
MNPQLPISTDSTSKVPTNRRHLQVGVAAVLISFSISCGKKPEVSKSTEASPAQPKAVTTTSVSDTHLDSLITDALEPLPAERQNALADEAESIIDKYPNKTAADLLNVPEVNESLKVALTKLGQDKKLLGQINSTVELAARMQGLEAKPGSVGLDLQVQNYDRPRTSRMLQAVLSEDPKRIVGFLVEEIGEATPELTYDGVYRASNGVAIKENPPPAK